MRFTKSPLKSSQYIYDGILLNLNETAMLRWYNESITFVPSDVNKNEILIKCIENSEYSITATILNDSTISLLDKDLKKKIILKKFRFNNDFINCGEVFSYTPFYYSFKRKYFKSVKMAINTVFKSTQNIEFISDCKLNGLENFVSYDLYAGGIEDTPALDIISFSLENNKTSYYNFEIEKDTIYLYNLISCDDKKNIIACDSLYSELRKGSLIYKLTK